MRVLVPSERKQGSVPMLFKVILLFLDDCVLFLFIHLFSIWSSKVWPHNSILDALFEEVGGFWIVLDTVRDNFLHSDWLPVSE